MAGELTRSEMVDEVLDNLTKSSAGQTKSGKTLATMAIRWLNRAQLAIARTEDFLFRISTTSTVADQQSYTFPTDIRSLYTLRLEDGLSSRKLTLVMPQEMDRLAPKPDEETTGIPTFYVPYKTTNTFELYRIPDASYTMRLRHSFWPAALESDSQTSDYTYMDDVITAYATSFGWAWLQEYGDMREWQKIAAQAFIEARNAARDAFPDWVAVGRGFSSEESVVPIGEYYNNPFIKEIV